MLIRHASIVDNLLPAELVARPHGIRLRYVLKRELLADPCLDIAGRRLPNYFVRRGTGEAQELERVRALGHGLGPARRRADLPRGDALHAGAPSARDRAHRRARRGPGRAGGAAPASAAAAPRRRRRAARRRTGSRHRGDRPPRLRRPAADLGHLAWRPRRARGPGPRHAGGAVRGTRGGCRSRGLALRRSGRTSTTGSTSSSRAPSRGCRHEHRGPAGRRGAVSSWCWSRGCGP